MQFQATAGTHVGQFLYVDTAWANRGNEQYLAFAWSARRDSTSLNESGSFLWGDSFEPMFYASSDLDHSNHKPDYVAYVTENAQSYASWMADSINFISAYMKDSLMENQSKFRVVYDPYVDSTLINVYQTRVKHPDYTNGAQNATWPYWWVNSFDRIPNSNIGPDNYFTRPSDAQTNTVYGDFLFAGSGSTYPIAKGAYDYYAAYVSALASQSTGHRYSDEVVSSNYEGHGKPHGIYNFHSFQEYYVKSMYGNMDKVMISTADTVPIYKEYYEDQVPSALSHTYSWSLTGKGGTPVKVEPKYKDSLFYVDIQDLGGSTIITLDQSYKNGGLNLDTHIKLAYGDKCVESESNAKATIKNGLYLIRNSLGQYLSVPIWSITDSVYWVTPESDEDLRKIPSYQWAIINTRNVDHSPFRMVNREFERVNFPYVYVYENSSAPFQIAGQYGNAAFNNKDVHAGVSKDSINLAGHNSNINPNKFVDELEKLYSIGEISFIRLGKDIKENQFLGYKYIDKDAAFMDIYAFKYLHHSTKGGGTPRYLSWNGYEEGSTDTTVYALGQDYFDKLYFNLQEMESDEIRPLDDKGNGKVSLTADNTKAGKPNADLADVYKELSSKEHLYTNADSIVLERFGFYEKNTGIPHLKPLVRQAYRLFLQDHYKWRPTEKGHYLTVGEQERYVLADKAQIINAANNYLPGSGSAFGVFGVPHFYFRNTFFDVDRKGDDYFAFVQRLDTVRAGVSWIGGGNAGSYRDIEEYLKYKHGSIAAGRVLNLIKESNELGVAILTVEDITARAVFSLRGDRAVTLSTFQLEKDNDPVYRRFHVNEPNEKFGDELYGTDIPDTLEFHILNKEKVGWRLYENSGNYTDPIELQGNRYGAYGGRVYNRSNDGEGDYYRDTLANVISFLGMHNSAETPKPNYSIFVDTAYINRGTGWIKPQYLLVVDPYNPYEKGDCDPNTGGNLDGPNGNYVIGRYLYNTAMYAKAVSASARNKLGNNDLSNVLSEVTTAAGDKVEGYFYKSDNFSKVEPIENTVKRNPNGAAYTYDGNWERLAFTWAIHKGDSLYVLKGVEPAYKGQHIDDPKALWQQLTKEYGSSGYIDFNKLITQNTADIYKEAFYPLGDRSPLPEMRTYRTFRSYEAVKAAGKTIGLQAIINLADNTHKDWVFSFRYIERGASDFIIESETSERNTNVSSVILPVLGGWVKSQNGVPVITRSDIKNTMGQASGAIFNVKRVTNPVGNEEVNTVASEVKVVAGTGAVSILNATGKNVVISNILGQTIANTTVSSDNASIAVPAGVAVVIVEGESAVKVLVK
jgi:hypothetical protein